jgi:RNA polymerase sigma factor (sigma-70 family)
MSSAPRLVSTRHLSVRDGQHTCERDDDGPLDLHGTSSLRARRCDAVREQRGGRPLGVGMTEGAKASYQNFWKGGRASDGRYAAHLAGTRNGTVMSDPSLSPTPADRTAKAYRKHFDLLAFLAGRRFRIPGDEVGGVVHDVFLAFLQNASKITATEADERSWLVGAVCNASRYYWRKNRGEELPADIGGYIDPCTIADTAIARMTIATVLRGLPTRCRTVLTRRYAEGYTPEEIALGEALTRGSAKNLLSKCLLAARAAFHRLRRVP